MADTQQLGIEVIAEVQQAIQDLGNLLDSINQFPDSKQSIIDVQTQGDQEVETLKTDVDGLDNKNVTLNVDDGDVKSAGVDADTLATNLDDAGNSATILEGDINGIDATPIEDAANAANDLGNNMDGASSGADNASGSMDGAAQSTSGVGMAAGLASLGIGALVWTAVSGAGTVQDQWGRIGVIYHMSADEAQSAWGGAISNMTSTTGRGASDVRSYILGMGIVGVKSSDLITQSFNAIASASGATGIPLQGMANTLEKVAATGRIGRGTLQQLGLTTDDVGMSTADLTKKLQGMTAEQRTAYLTGLVAAKYGQAGNEEYKVSWEDVLDSLTRAGEYMSRILGATILPLVAGAINGVSWALGGMASWIDHLNGPMGTIVKIAIGVMFAFVALAAVIIGLASAYNVLKIPQALVTLQTAYQTTVLGLQKAAMVASAFATDGLSGAMAVLRGTTTLATAEAAAFTGQTELLTASQNTGILATVRAGASRLLMAGQSIIAAGASGILTAAQWALNIALDANPIGLVVLAIAALIGALVWAYYNIKPVHDAVDFLWKLIMDFWNSITHMDGSKLWTWLSSGIQESFGKIYNFFWGLAAYLISLPQNMQKWGEDIILGLINGIVNAIPGLRQALSAIGINFPQSPPKEGPLAAVTKEGAESWTSGIAGAMSKGLSKFSLTDSIGSLPSLTGMPSTASAVGGSNGANHQEFHVHEGAVVIKGNADKEVVQNAGAHLASGMSDEMQKGMGANGIKPMVMMRK